MHGYNLKLKETFMFQKNEVVRLDKTICSVYDSAKMVKTRPGNEAPIPWEENYFPSDSRFEKIVFTPRYFFNPYEMKMAREILQEIKRLTHQEEYKDFNYEDLKNEEFEIKARDFVKLYYPGLSHSIIEGRVKTFNRTMYKLAKFSVDLHTEENKEFSGLFSGMYCVKKTNTWKFKIPILMQIVRFDKARHEDLFLLNYENKYYKFENYEDLSQLALQIVLYTTSKYERSRGKLKILEIDLTDDEFLETFWSGFNKLNPRTQSNKLAMIRKALKELSSLDSHKKYFNFVNKNLTILTFN
jgi:hypothetical protein